MARLSFRPDIGIDLGTASCLVYKGNEIVIHTHGAADRVPVGILVPEDDNLPALTD